MTRFDGDGMLHGVWFKRKGNLVEPCFANKLLATDILLAERRQVLIGSRSVNLSLNISFSHGSTLLPSIATLISPASNPIYVIFDIVKAALLCLKYRVFRLSVANTNIIYHNSTALATCEDGPFLQVELPTLKSIGWREYTTTPVGKEAIGKEAKKLSIFEEWATGHVSFMSASIHTLGGKVNSLSCQASRRSYYFRVDFLWLLISTPLYSLLRYSSRSSQVSFAIASRCTNIHQVSETHA